MENLDFTSPWQKLAETWPPYMTAGMVAEKSGGILAKQTLYNYTAQGRGIRNGRRAGRNIVYPKLEVVQFLMEFCGEKQREDV